MVQTIAARTIKLSDLRLKFGLQRTEGEGVFPEWQENLPNLTEIEKQAIDRLKTNYLYLLESPVMESIVKMVVLSPLLDRAGFDAPPFRVTGEEAIEVEAEDEGEIIRGSIDVLVLQNRFWLTVIEAKNSELALTKAIPQCLTYMLANPDPENPTFGAVTNGTEFLFLKLIRDQIPQYSLSDTFSLLNRGNDYYNVLQILKRFAELLQ